MLKLNYYSDGGYFLNDDIIVLRDKFNGLLFSGRFNLIGKKYYDYGILHTFIEFDGMNYIFGIQLDYMN